MKGKIGRPLRGVLVKQKPYSAKKISGLVKYLQTAEEFFNSFLENNATRNVSFVLSLFDDLACNNI
jgi:hypothetical protein